MPKRIEGGYLGARPAWGDPVSPGLWTPESVYARRVVNTWPGQPDPFLAYVALLMHFNGANNSTTFTDSSLNAYTLSTSGTPKISTDQSRFDGSSLYLDGSSSISIATALKLQAQDFAVECWIRQAVITGVQTIFNQGNSDSVGNWCLGVDNSGKLIFYADSFQRYTGTATISANTWTHVAMTRSGTTYRFFRNGALDGSYTGTHTHSGAPFKIGNGYGGIGPFGGYMDEVRVTLGVPRYTAAFATQTATFPNP